MRFLTLSVLVLATSLSCALGASRKISSGLSSTLQAGPTDILITFAKGTDDVLREIAGTPFPDRTTKLRALVQALVLNSIESQATVRSFLLANGHMYDELWVQDQLFVKQVPEALVARLAEFPEVVKITENELTIFRQPLANNDPSITFQSRKAKAEVGPLAEWGVEKVRAEAAINWLNNATTPTPIRVATIDSGVRGTHEAMRDNFLGLYGWFDPVGRSAVPYDDGGHGTHTTGTLAGGLGIGVFPDAKWMACVGCEDTAGYCSLYAMIRCGQWVLCPTLTDGSSVMDCSQAPHVVSNSWGITGQADWYDAVIAAWQVGGLLPVFSMGNAGPNCNTTGYPGRLEDVIGVGSTTTADAISSFSSLGPTPDGRQKPEISAPGSAVVSASHLSDTGYRTLSGTSMACPHAAGVAAILMSYNPDLTYGQIVEALESGAAKNLSTSGRVCGSVPDTQWPNYTFGYGRIDALNSLQIVANMTKKN